MITSGFWLYLAAAMSGVQIVLGLSLEVRSSLYRFLYLYRCSCLDQFKEVCRSLFHFVPSVAPLPFYILTSEAFR